MMPFVKQSFLVPKCRLCGNLVDFTGEGGYTVVRTKSEGQEWLDGICVDSIEEACGCAAQKAASKRGKTK